MHSPTGYKQLAHKQKADIFQSAFCFTMCNAVTIFPSRFVLIYPALSRLSCWMGWVFLKGFQLRRLAHQSIHQRIKLSNQIRLNMRAQQAQCAIHATRFHFFGTQRIASVD